jgi:hypothetical protein
LQEAAIIAISISRNLFIPKSFLYQYMAKEKALKGKELTKAIVEAQNDPEFIREIKKFIRATT